MTASTLVLVVASLLPADFGITVTPTSVAMITGQTLSPAATVETTRVGEAGTVALAASVSPADLGVIASIDVPAVAAGGSAVLTLVTVGGAAAGTYVITVTGTEGANVHAATLELVVSALQQPGSGGCSTAGRAAGALWPLAAVAALLLPRRRRAERARRSN